MKRLFCVYLLVAFSQQVKGQVSGHVQDAQGGPVPFANVILLQDSSIVKGAVTDEQGHYLLTVPDGQYHFRINAIGYQVLDIPALRVSGAISMGVQVLQTNRQQLGVVVVKGNKPLVQQKAEGMVLNVESSIMSKGSMALEVLERAPGIVIDHRDGNISLNGKSGVTVLLNGKLLRLPLAQVIAMLSSMRADDIEKIELLTTPGAGYDAEGNAGVINIVLKKNAKLGTSGSMSVTGGHGWGEKAGTSVQAGYNTGKTNYYGAYSFNHDRANSNWHAIGTADEPLLGGKTISDVTGVMQPVNNSHNIRLGVEGAHIGASVVYGNSHTHIHNINSGVFTVLPDSVLYNQVDVNEYMKWKNLIADVYVEGKHVSVNADYLRYTNDRPSTAVNSFVNQKGQQIGDNDTLFAPLQKGYAHTQIDAGVLKLDYKTDLDAKLRLEAGVKGNYTRTRSASGISSLVKGELVTGANAAHDGWMKEWIGAGYASLRWQLDTGMVLTVGSRYEYADTRLDDIHRRLGKLFPVLSFTKQFSGGHELLLSYTKRISRPSYTDLASYKSYTGPNSFETGNPSLLPSLTNIVKVGYTYKGYSFAILASRDDHPIVRWQMTETPDSSVLIVSSQNMKWQNNLTFQLSVPVKVTDWWSMNYNITGGWRHFRVAYTRRPGERKYFTTSVNFSELFTFSKDWSAELSGYYNGPSYDGSKQVDGFGVLNVGVKKELGKGTIQFAIADVLGTLHIPFYYGRLTEEAHDLRTRVVYSGESTYVPVMKLTYFRAFGGKSNGHRLGADEEAARMR